VRFLTLLLFTLFMLDKSKLVALLLFANPLFSNTIQVTNTDNSTSPGSLGAAILAAVNGTVIDCSPIAGQTIGLGSPHLPAIGFNFTAPTDSLTILGNGVIIDGGGSSIDPTVGVPIFALGQGSATISNFIIQNGNSKGGNGGFGKAGGGGGTGGGGALYLHSGTTLTISTLSLSGHKASGGAGGAAESSEGSGGGGGGFGGGNGGTASTAGGSGGGGGGNSGGAAGGNVGAGSPNTFSNYGGAGGGGQRISPTIITGNGGSVAATSLPAHSGGAGSSGGAGGGGGSGGGGSAGFSGFGGIGGQGLGVNLDYGVGGGGAGSISGAIGGGASGGGGGGSGLGGSGGALGGGGGGSGSGSGGNAGFGAGGGAGRSGGGIDMYGLGGTGGSGSPAGGGGGSGLGGAIVILDTAQLIIQDGVTFSGNSTMAGHGGIGAGNGSSLGQDIFIQSGGSVTFQINGTLSLDNPIEGAGSSFSGTGVLMSGAGTVGLSGVNTYFGATHVQSGTLNLNGSVSGDIHVDTGGTLTGNATANGSIFSSGTLKPGNSVGQMFTTDLVLTSTNTYDVEIDTLGNSNEIVASGTAQLAGGIYVMPDSSLLTGPIVHTIISANGGVTGTFSSLASDPGFTRLIYDPFTVELIFIPASYGSIAECFLTLDVATINNVLLGLSFDTLSDAFKQMGPAQFSGLTNVQLLDAVLVRSTYTQHLQDFFFNNDQRCGRSVSLWVDGVAQWQKQKNSFGYRDTTLGGTIGVDYSFRNWIVGGAFSSTDDSFHLKEFPSKASINSYYGGLYGAWSQNGFCIDMAFLGAYNKYWTKRSLDFGTIDSVARAQHSGNELLTHVGFGYQLRPSTSYLFTPYIDLDYVLQHENSYTESGVGILDLHVHTKNATLFQGEVGILFSTNYSACKGVFTPTLSLAYMNQTPCSSRKYRANFVDSYCSFKDKGGNFERNLFAPSLAFTYQSANNFVNASIYYAAEVGSKYWAQNVGFDLSFHF